MYAQSPTRTPVCDCLSRSDPMTVKRITPHTRERKLAISRGKTKSSRDGSATPLELMKALGKKTLDAKLLTRDQRKAILILMGLGKKTGPELAVILGCDPSMVRKLNREIRSERGGEVTSWTREEILGSMVMAAEKCSAMAYDQEDAQLAWAIERDKVKLLKEVGVLEPTSSQEGIRLTIEALGNRYERATQILHKTLDPRLTGRVVVDAEHTPSLALPTVVKGEGSEDLGQPDPGSAS